MGRFTIAAKHHQTIAEIYESEVADLERAMQHYEKSADYFRVRFTVWKNEKFFLTEKKFREINSLVTSSVKLLVSRNFCQKSEREFP